MQPSGWIRGRKTDGSPPTLEVQKPLCSAGLYKKFNSKCFDIIKNYIKEEKLTIRKYYDMKTC